MNKVRIYQKSKNAMQSGRALTGRWVLEYESDAHRTPEPLMGWTQSDDTMEQVRLYFDSCEKAKEYAVEKNLGYTILPSHERKIRPRNYSDNFKYIPPEDDE